MISWHCATAAGKRKRSGRSSACGWRNGACPGPVPQQGEDPDRPDKRRLRFPLLRHTPLPDRPGRQGPHQAQPRCDEEDPAEARRRTARDARFPGGRGALRTQPGHQRRTTTGPGRPRSPSRHWTATCGSSFTSGLAAGTPGRAGNGSPPATSARTARTGATGGSSATGKPGPTSTSTPGRRSSGTRRSPAGTHLTTLPWPDTGPTGGASRNPRNWPRPGKPPCGTSTGCARYAGNRCCSPTARQTPPASGRPGTRPSARR